LIEKGLNAGTQIPFARWDHEEYYDPEEGAYGSYYNNHASFMEGVHLFDNRLFGIATYEAS
jgi:acyl transferase domain-containing protein